MDEHGVQARPHDPEECLKEKVVLMEQVTELTRAHTQLMASLALSQKWEHNWQQGYERS